VTWPTYDIRDHSCHVITCPVSIKSRHHNSAAAAAAAAAAAIYEKSIREELVSLHLSIPSSSVRPLTAADD